MLKSIKTAKNANMITTAITDTDREYIFTNFNFELLKKIRESSKRNTYDRVKIKNQFIKQK